MPAIGPFFWIRNKIIANTTPLETAEKYGDKLTGGLSHSDLFDRIVKGGEYMLIPRGRVVWDSEKNEGIIYIDKCLNELTIIDEICKTFELVKFRVEYDEHYICPKCKPNSFSHLM